MENKKPKYDELDQKTLELMNDPKKLREFTENELAEADKTSQALEKCFQYNMSFADKLQEKINEFEALDKSTVETLDETKKMMDEADQHHAEINSMFKKLHTGNKKLKQTLVEDRKKLADEQKINDEMKQEVQKMKTEAALESIKVKSWLRLYEKEKPKSRIGKFFEKIKKLWS